MCNLSKVHSHSVFILIIICGVLPSISAATDLHDAVLKGDGNLVTSLLEMDPDINNMGSADGPPLFLAVTVNNLDIAKILIEKGADVEATARTGKLRPMHRAATNNNAEMIRLLVNSGAKVNSRNFEKKTPLIMAAREGNLDAINELIDSEADIDESDRVLKKTPLHYAVGAGQVDAVKLLVTRGADVNAVARRGRTALFHAAMLDSLTRVESTELITYLVNNGALDAADILAEQKSSVVLAGANEAYRPLYDAMIAELERLVSN